MDFSDFTLSELKDYCKTHKIRGYSNKNKRELVEFIQKEMEGKEDDEEEQEGKEGISKYVELFIGDSIEILKNIREKVDLIYMDPPYETNRKFTLDSKKEEIGFSDTWEKDEYAKWLNQLILLSKNVLSEKGSLVVHISAENSFSVEKILREHFPNIEKIFWKRCHGKNTVKNKMGAVIDIIFIAYSKKRIFNQIYIPIEEDSVWAFKNEDERGFYSLGALKHDRTRKGYEYSIFHEGVEYKNTHGWKMEKDKVEKLISENRIHFVPKSHNMYVKIYKHEHQGKPLSNLWDDIHSITRSNKDPRLYPTQKPQKLLERIILLLSDENSLILDPVCGSGTTGFVCEKLKRKCILIDCNPEVEKIINSRLKK